ncbi:transporter [Silvibacterium sp.]|uniref:transporter n=1 Tax=Silvibacterium sp. TaxID=1964179 RepID=UPI0039E59F29
MPLNQPYPMLIQVFRADFARQITPTHTDTWNYGNSKGLNLIPGLHSEFDFYYPPYIEHNVKTAKDGFGDAQFLYKYRLLSGNEEHGNYLLSLLLGASIPTGSYSNGSADAAILPTIAGGKGFGHFDVISTVGANLPTAQGEQLGRTLAWNTTAQYRLAKYVIPELESNATWFFAGKTDGKMQNFLEPGITFGKLKIHPQDPKSRPGFSFGGGMQIATSEYHAYNHALIFTGRFLF